MWLWVDDVRPVPPGWVGARSVNEAIVHLAAGVVEFASLDHDLGDFAGDGGDGSAVTDWMAEHDTWPTGGVRVHSANPVGVATMLATVDRYGPYPYGAGPRRGHWPPAVLATVATAPDQGHQHHP